MSEEPPGVDLADVRAAAGVLAPLVHRTPVITSRTLDSWTGARLLLKAESLQRTGSFKIRGAHHALHRLGDAARSGGVVTASSGNFGQALALAAAERGVPATVLMPADASAGKLAATREYGAEVVTYDRYAGDRDALAASLAAERGAPLVSPFDDPDVIAGQGTVALELLEEVGDLDLLVVPVGGGGLAAGCAAVAAAMAPGVEVVGVEPEGRDAARAALRTGRPVRVAVPRTVLDGQQTTHVGEHPLRVLREHLDRVVGIGDEAALAAMRLAVERLRLVLEPSGAAALGAVLDGAVPVTGRRVGVVCSGGNVDAARLAELLAAVGSPR